MYYISKQHSINSDNFVTLNKTNQASNTTSTFTIFKCLQYGKNACFSVMQSRWDFP